MATIVMPQAARAIHLSRACSGRFHQEKSNRLGAASAVPLANGSSEAANDSPEAYLAFGSFARQRITMRSNSLGNCGLCRDGGGGSAATICAHTAVTDEPSKGRTPVAIWYRMMPREKMSDRWSWAPPLICSGER